MKLPKGSYKDKPCLHCGEKKVRYGRRICSGCQSRIRRGKPLSAPWNNRPQQVPNTPADKPAAARVDPSYDQEWQKFCDWLGIRKARLAKVPQMSRSDRVRYGVISDLHIPFHDEKALAEAVDWMSEQGVSILYVGGDILDCYSLSRFNQYQHIPIRREVQEARKVMDHLSRIFAQVRVIEGNHEARERKYLSARLDPDMLEFMLTKGILERVCEDMANVRMMTHTVHNTKMGWLTEVGDAVIGHPEKWSKIPLRPVEWFNEWLHNWHHEIGFGRPRLVVAGHTHMAGCTWVGTTMVVESGCLSLIQGYALEPRLYSKPQRTAATIFDQINGVTDLNSVRQYYPCQK